MGRSRSFFAAALVALASSAAAEGPLVIRDPAMVEAAVTIPHEVAYATYLGGDGADTATGIARDGAGNLYVCGTTASRSFPKGLENPPAPVGKKDAYVLKLDPTGEKVLTCWRYGSVGEAEGRSIAIDNAGNIFLAGHCSPDFVPTLNLAKKEKDVRMNLMLIKISPEGKALGSVMISSNGNTIPTKVVLDKAGNPCVVGSFFGKTWPTTPDAFEKETGCRETGFLTVLDKDLKKILYSTMLVTTDTWAPDVHIWDIAAGGDGTLTICGDSMPKLATTPGALSTGKDRTTGYAARFNPAGKGKGSVVWLTMLPVSGSRAWSLALDKAGNVVLGGTASMDKAEDFPVKAGDPVGGGAIQPKRVAKSGAFVMKVSGKGTAMMSAGLFGGDNSEKVMRVLPLPSGEIYYLGDTFSTTFPDCQPIQFHPGGSQPGAGGDLFILRLAADGKVEFCSAWGGVSGETFGDALVTPGGELFIVGSCGGPGLPTTKSAMLANSGKKSSGFLLHVKPKAPAAVLQRN